MTDQNGVSFLDYSWLKEQNNSCALKMRGGQELFSEAADQTSFSLASFILAFLLLLGGLKVGTRDISFS